MASEHEDLLKEVPLFSGFSRRERRRLVDAMKDAWFNAGEDIITEGQAGARFYVIVEGRAKLIVGGDEKKTLGPGSYFGEMALLDRSPRSATVRAETRVKALFASSTEFLALLEEQWDMTRKILAELSKRIRALEAD